jgi:hypothetical protein
MRRPRQIVRLSLLLNMVQLPAFRQSSDSLELKRSFKVSVETERDKG